MLVSRYDPLKVLELLNDLHGNDYRIQNSPLCYVRGK